MKTMFLDDQLIQICIDAEIDTPDDVQQVYSILIKTCEDYYKSKIRLNMSNSEAKIVFDRTFKLWDSFVRMAVKHTNNQVVILGRLCNNYSFKNAFLSINEMSELYKRL